MYLAADCPCNQHCYSISLKICHQHLCKRIILPGHCLYYIYHCICYSAGLYNALPGAGTVCKPIKHYIKKCILICNFQSAVCIDHAFIKYLANPSVLRMDRTFYRFDSFLSVYGICGYLLCELQILKENF